jgi:carbon monoxide dehydrogenase subunit G
MAEGSVSVTVSVPPEEAWSVAGSFDGIAEWFPGIESFRIEGDDRVIGMFGMEIREHLIARDDAARVLEYSVVDGVPLEAHRAKISVAPDGDGSVVTWWYDVEPDEMAPIFGDTYQKALDAVAARLAG